MGPLSSFPQTTQLLTLAHSPMQVRNLIMESIQEIAKKDKVASFKVPKDIIIEVS